MTNLIYTNNIKQSKCQTIPLTLHSSYTYIHILYVPIILRCQVSLSLSDQNLLHTSTMQHLIQRINPPNFQRRRLHIADRQVARLNSLQQQSGVCHKEMNKRTIRDFAWYDPEYNHQHFTKNTYINTYLCSSSVSWHPNMGRTVQLHNEPPHR